MKALADIAGAGAIAQIWMTPTGAWRDSILRFYWDGAGALGRMPGRRFLCLRMEQVCAGVVAGGLRESRQRVQLLLGDAVSQTLPDYYDQYRRHGNDTILSNQLHAHRSTH